MLVCVCVAVCLCIHVWMHIRVCSAGWGGWGGGACMSGLTGFPALAISILLLVCFAYRFLNVAIALAKGEKVRVNAL